ncbi:MAG: PA2779 family protein, partial [Nitrospiraceae bacterium]
LSRLILRQAMIWMLLVTTFGMGWYPSEAKAMLAPAQTTATEESISNQNRVQGLEKVQRVLEHKLIRQRLEDLGLSTEEAHARLDRLSDAQLHQLAMQIESLIPGGLERELGIILTVLLIILVAVVIIILV